MDNTVIFFLWYILWICAVIGIGAGIFRLIKIQALVEYRIFEYGITGFIIIILIIGALNFFIPIWWMLPILIMIIGIISFLKEYPIKYLFSITLLKYYCVIPIIFCGILVYFHTVQDTGGYHLVAINWIVSQSIPFGLANLCSRLGFNTTWFLTNACLDQLVFLFHRPLFITNAIVFFLYLTSVFKIFELAVQKENEKKIGLLKRIRKIILISYPGDLFLIFSILPAIDMARRFISSASPDMPVFLLEILTISVSINIISNKYADYFRIHALFLIGIISVLTFTIKTSAFPLLILVIIIYLAEISRVRNCFSTKYIKQLILQTKEPYFLIFIVLSIISVFLIRGIILSGNPIFPIPLPILINFPWSASTELCYQTLQEVIKPALLYGSDDNSLLYNNNWLKHWIIEFLKNTVSLIFVWACAIIGYILHLFYYRENGHCKDFFVKLSGYLIILCLIFSLIFWFKSAPDPRFGFGFLFSLPIIILIMPTLGCNGKKPKGYSSFLSFVLLAFLTFSLILCGTLIVSQGVNIPEMPEYTYTLVHSINGEEIYFSHSGDQNWDMPLPVFANSQLLRVYK